MDMSWNQCPYCTVEFLNFEAADIEAHVIKCAQSLMHPEVVDLDEIEPNDPEAQDDHHSHK